MRGSVAWFFHKTGRKMLWLWIGQIIATNLKDMRKRCNFPELRVWKVRDFSKFCIGPLARSYVWNGRGYPSSKAFLLTESTYIICSRCSHCIWSTNFKFSSLCYESRIDCYIYCEYHSCFHLNVCKHPYSTLIPFPSIISRCKRNHYIRGISF